jgi:ABC-type nitrate/sulfonate/bicarbonate transport system ATPase subunit
LNLAEIRRYKNNSDIENLKGKNVILLIGKSGVGKTTFLLYSNGIELKAVKKDEFEPVNPELVKNSKISSKTIS